MSRNLFSDHSLRISYQKTAAVLERQVWKTTEENFPVAKPWVTTAAGEGGRGPLTFGNALETSANTGFLTLKSSASVSRFLLIIFIMSGWLLLLSYPLVCLLRPLSPVSRIMQILRPGCIRLCTSSLKSPKARPPSKRAQPKPHWDPGGIAAGHGAPHTAPKPTSPVRFTPLLVCKTLSRQTGVVCRFPSP